MNPPPVIRGYIEASNAHDVKGIMDCFAADAVVRDENATRHGKIDIGRWATETIEKYKFQFKPLSADELNWIPAAQIGNGTVPDFGFPTNYTVYRTGALVGGGGVQPLLVFQPQPDPFTGSESEGPNDIAFAPRGFPNGLNNGIFIGFHGRFNLGGIPNEENPLVFVDLSRTNYFQFIGNDEPNIGHLDGLLSTDDSLFIADLASTGDISTAGHAGVIYQIKSAASRVLSFTVTNRVLHLSWQLGVLQRANSLSGPWNDVPGASSPFVVAIDANQPSAFYRTKY